jgi:hypothetical protein
MTQTPNEGIVPKPETDRPEFDRVLLTADVDSAVTLATERVKGLATTETDEGVKFRTTDGTLVAIVDATTDGPAAAQSTLSYRTGPASSDATRKARRLWAALDTLEP